MKTSPVTRWAGAVIRKAHLAERHLKQGWITGSSSREQFGRGQEQKLKQQMQHGWTNGMINGWSYESWTTLLLNPTLIKDESLWSSHWCLIRTHHNYPLNF